MFNFRVIELKDGTTVAGLEGDVCYVTTFTPNSSYYAYHAYIYTPISEVEYIIGTQSLNTDQLYDLCYWFSLGVFESFDDALKYYNK